MLNKFLKILSLTILISACEKEEVLKNKSTNPELKNFEIKSVDKNDAEFTLKAKSAIDKSDYILIKNLKISFSKNALTGQALSGEYNKKNNNITIKDIILKNKDIKLNSKSISFNQNKGITDSKEVFMTSELIRLNGHNLKTDKSFENIYLKKVKANIKY